MKTALFLLCASALAALALPSCTPPPPPPDPEPPPVREVHHYYHESAPARSETPEDFRAVTPPSSYSR